eukprot:6175691-Pleurochrysis_carterae.AAC.2
MTSRGCLEEGAGGRLARYRRRQSARAQNSSVCILRAAARSEIFTRRLSSAKEEVVMQIRATGVDRGRRRGLRRHSSIRAGGAMYRHQTELAVKLQKSAREGPTPPTRILLKA